MSRWKSVLLLAISASAAHAAFAQPPEIGLRRELFVDDAMIQRMTGRAELRLHHPVPREVAIVTDQPWEGNGTNYVTVFRDSDVYRMYYRGSQYSYLHGKDRPNHRDLYCYAESRDGIRWTEPELLTYSALADPGRKAPVDAATADVRDPVGARYPPGRVSELYTNQILPYYRAPHLLLGFPTRYIDRGWTEAAKALPQYDYRQVRAKQSRREGTALTDGMFMVSRDRRQFAIWPESFLRPGLRTRDSWFYGDTYQNWGLVETKSALEDGPPELSIYVTDGTLQDKPAQLRRYTLRVDGFVSLHAPLVGGEVVTRPLTFRGQQLVVNYSTSAAGSVRVEIQNLDGRPIPGYTLADAQELYGDSLEQSVQWKGGGDVGQLAGQPVRLRFVLKDADLYSIQFQKPAGSAPRT